MSTITGMRNCSLAIGHAYFQEVYLMPALSIIWTKESALVGFSKTIVVRIRPESGFLTYPEFNTCWRVTKYALMGSFRLFMLLVAHCSVIVFTAPLIIRASLNFMKRIQTFCSLFDLHQKSFKIPSIWLSRTHMRTKYKNRRNYLQKTVIEQLFKGDLGFESKYFSNGDFSASP